MVNAEKIAIVPQEKGYDTAVQEEATAKQGVSTWRVFAAGSVLAGCVVAAVLMAVVSAQGNQVARLGGYEHKSLEGKLGQIVFGGAMKDEDVTAEHASRPSCGLQSEAAACYCEHLWVCESKDPTITGDCELPCYMAESIETGERICVPMDDAACCVRGECCEEGMVEGQTENVWRAKHFDTAAGTCGYTFLTDSGKEAKRIQDGRPVEQTDDKSASGQAMPTEGVLPKEDYALEHAGLTSCGSQSDAAACYCEHMWVCESKDPNVEGDCALPCYLAESTETGEKVCVPLDDGACCEKDTCCEKGEVDGKTKAPGVVWRAKFYDKAPGLCGYTFLTPEGSVAQTMEKARPVEAGGR